jgi:hypothetical protein
MLLRSGLAQDFAEGFNLDFLKSFLARVWKELLLGSLFLAMTGILAVLVGAAVFCVGVYFAASLLMLAQAHIWYQIYQIYLARGGKPIPLPSPAQNP